MTPVQQIVASAAVITAQAVVRDKDGNVKYAGPIVMTPIKGDDDGRNAQHGSPERSG